MNEKWEWEDSVNPQKVPMPHLFLQISPLAYMNQTYFSRYISYKNIISYIKSKYHYCEIKD